MSRLCFFVLLSMATPVLAQNDGLSPVSAKPAQCKCWAGMYPTVLTPWQCGGCGVDAKALAAEIRYQLVSGVHGLLMLGTLGEGMYASEDERAEVISIAVKESQGKVPVVVGIHTGDAQCALQQLQQAKALGAQAVLVKYLGPAHAPFDEVLGFFHSLDSTELLPIFFYHIPGSVDRPLKPQEVVQVLSLPHVVGAKESTLDLREVQAHIQGVCGQGKIFLSGTALNLTQFRGVGGHGAMCPEAAILPVDAMNAYETAYELGNRHAARQQQRDLFMLAPLLKGGLITENGARMITMTSQDLKLPQKLGRDSSQARLKQTLRQLGILMNSDVKPPLPPLSDWDRILVNTTVSKINNR